VIARVVSAGSLNINVDRLLSDGGPVNTITAALNDAFSFHLINPLCIAVITGRTEAEVIKEGMVEEILNTCKTAEELKAHFDTLAKQYGG
jgi:hypothetical protein